MNLVFTRRGFLPEHDPLRSFAPGSELAALDELGHDLPSLLHDPGCRTYLLERTIPPLPADWTKANALAELRLYYVRLGFLASAYVNQVGQSRATLLPRNLAVPLCDVCRMLGR